MKVLVACEMSGVVRDAFRERGHDAVSCDLEPSERPGPHYQGDVFDIITESWDLMIAFPPCTYLTVSGNRWMNHPDFPERAQKRRAAMRFFYDLAMADIDRIAIENPRGVMSTRFRPADQLIQPWMFGHREEKQTFLWLKNLPRLRSTKVVSLPDAYYARKRILAYGPGAHRQKLRSYTYPGVARAMADQWGQI